MFGKRITLFTLFGFRVHIDASWLIIALLVTWSLATGFFPYRFENLSTQTYWILGVLGALGLFVSIVFHEMWHSLVARRFGLPMTGITLFVFGGVAEMHEEPQSPKAEFFMAIAGPISSLVLGAGFWVVHTAMAGAWPEYIGGVLWYLAFLNVALAVFNLIPAFPLDGGRVLRAVLWHFKGDLKSATSIASKTGGAFGIMLIAYGILNMLYGNLVGGVWYFVIGLFLRSIAQGSYRQVQIREALGNAKVRDLMNKEPVSVSPDASLQELVDDYVYKLHFKMFPVTENGMLKGCVSTKKVKSYPREEWGSRTVGQAAADCSDDNTVSPDTDVIKALKKMQRTGNSRLMAVDNGRLMGIIALKDVMGYLSVHMDLEEDEELPGSGRPGP